MCFYDDWFQCIKLKENEGDYIEAFLKKKDFTIRIFNNGSTDEIATACKILVNYDIQRMIDAISDDYKNELEPSKIIQFSNFENGTTNLVQTLYNEEGGLSYCEIGRRLAGSVEEGAAIKYGENHSKLARDFNLVTIANAKPTTVKITNFGRCFVFLDNDEQIKLLRLLGLRDPLIQNLIIHAKKEITYYAKEASCLSVSTMIRRRGNVKKLFELIFDDLDFSIINNIIW